MIYVIAIDLFAIANYTFWKGSIYLKIIWKYIHTNVKERKTRTAVMLLSVILSTTLLFVSLSIGDSYASAQRKMARGVAGNATISVSRRQPEDGGTNWITQDSIPNLPSIKNMVGMIKTTALYKENGYYENFDILAADLEQLGTINQPRLVDGSNLEHISGNEIVLPERFTSKYGVQVGDTFSLYIRDVPIDFKVAAIAAYDTVFLRHTRGTTALLSKETLRQILNIFDGYSEIMIEPVDGTETEQLMSELSDVLRSNGFKISTIVNEAQVEAAAKQKSMPFFLISFFSLTMSVFIIFSSYKVITMERLPVIGTFRSIGATEKTVTHILMLESLFYGVLGGVLGIPLGFVVLKVMLQGLGNSLSQGIEIPMVVSPSAILIAIFVSVMVSLLSAYLPVKRASRLPIKDVVLGMVEEKHTSSIVKLMIGTVLLGISVIIPHLTSGKMLYVAGGFSLLGLIVATIIMIPLITSVASIVFESIYGVLFGNEGRLAARNMRDNKNISQNITLLFISISAVIAISVVGNFVNIYVGDVFRGAKLDGFADAAMSAEFVQQVTEIDGIGTVLPTYVFNNSIKGDDTTFVRMEATSDLRLYSDMYGLSYNSGESERKAETRFESTRTVVLSKDCLRKRGLKVGDTILMSANDNQYDYMIVGSFRSRANDTEAIIPSSYAESDFGAVNYGILAYTAADPEAVMIQIRGLLGNTSNWSRTVKEFNADASSTINAFLKPMKNMTYFILLLATVGIINNLLINYIQKRRAIAMYKSVGMSNTQNIKMTLIEGFTSGLLGAIIAMGVSYLEIKTIFLVAGPKIAMQPDLDVRVFFMAGGMGIVVTLIGSFVPIRKSAQMKIVEEIKFE